MFKRIPNFVLWMFLACTVASLPVACSEEEDNQRDAAVDRLPDTMTGA